MTLDETYCVFCNSGAKVPPILFNGSSLLAALSTAWARVAHGFPLNWKVALCPEIAASKASTSMSQTSLKWLQSYQFACNQGKREPFIFVFRSEGFWSCPARR